MSEDEEIAESVSKNGWHAVAIPDSPYGPFVYTCGLLTTRRHPELILFGLDVDNAHAILAALVEDVRKGTTFLTSERIEGILEGGPVATRRVDPSHHQVFFGYALGHVREAAYEGPFEARQVIWPDEVGRLPTESDCNPNVLRLQPSLHVARSSFDE